MPDTTLAIADPTAEVVFDTQRILVTKGGETNPDFDTVRWADSLPVLVQATLIKSFENAGYLKATKPIEGMIANHELRIDIQDFSISADAEPVANVAISAKVFDNSQAIKAAKVFKASVPVKDMEARPRPRPSIRHSAASPPTSRSGLWSKSEGWSASDAGRRSAEGLKTITAKRIEHHAIP